jgi:hypothetical protein
VRALLQAPAPQQGCARPARPRPPPGDGIRIWQGFAGNNSGDCVLVGRFERIEDAARYLADLAPGFRPGEPFGDAWRALLEREGVGVTDGECAPETLARAGRAVLLQTDMAVDDDFPALRALLWKRGGLAVYSGIHEHDRVALVTGMRFQEAGALEATEVGLDVEGGGEFRRRGLDLFGVAPASAGDLGERIASLETAAAERGATFGAELVVVGESVELQRALAARRPDGVERLWVRFDSVDEAARVRGAFDGEVAVAGRYAVLEGARLRPRAGARLHALGGTATWIEGERLELHATFWSAANAKVDCDALAAELAPHLRPFADLAGAEAQWSSVATRVTTSNPVVTLPALVDFGRARGLEVWIEAGAADRLAASIGRISDDLGVLNRRRRPLKKR